MTPDIEAALLETAERRFVQLMSDGVAEDVARDRVWDCYTRAYGENGYPLYDGHDSLFQTKLQTIAERSA